MNLIFHIAAALLLLILLIAYARLRAERELLIQLLQTKAGTRPGRVYVAEQQVFLRRLAQALAIPWEGQLTRKPAQRLDPLPLLDLHLQHGLCGMKAAPDGLELVYTHGSPSSEAHEQLTKALGGTTLRLIAKGDSHA